MQKNETKKIACESPERLEFQDELHRQMRIKCITQKAKGRIAISSNL
jgi:hypothetical protein